MLLGSCIFITTPEDRQVLTIVDDLGDFTISDVSGNLKEEALGDLVTFTVSLTAILSMLLLIFLGTILQKHNC